MTKQMQYSVVGNSSPAWQ